jgi:hypothetical protein
MSTTTNAPNNGATKTPAVKPAAEIKIEAPKTEAKKSPDKKEDEQMPLEDRIYRVQQLSDLIERHEKLQESLKKLQSFKLSSDGRGDEIVITDSKRNTWQTSNTAVIADVIEVMKATLQKKLSETEAQIFF